MTSLHRVARAVHPGLVGKILHGSPHSAGMITFASRAPGLCTPLMVLAERNMHDVHIDDVLCCLDLMLPYMNEPHAAQQNTKGNTVFHLAASRGNGQFLEHLCKRAVDQFGKEA